MGSLTVQWTSGPRGMTPYDELTLGDAMGSPACSRYGLLEWYGLQWIHCAVLSA